MYLKNFKVALLPVLIGICVFLISVVLMGVFASFAIPKLFRGNAGKVRERALVQEIFSIVGEAYLARLKDPNLPAQVIDGAPHDEAEVFGDYLHSRLNKLSSFYGDATVANDYCTAEEDYFTLAGGHAIRRICEATGPDRLEVTVLIRQKVTAHDIQFVITIPEEKEKYSTLFGQTGADCDCIQHVDPYLMNTKACPNPSKNRKNTDTCS